MQTKIKVVLIAALVFLGIFVIIQFFLPDKYVLRMFTKTGTLRVESVPKTNVFVNSTLVGQTPLQTNLKVGIYSVKLVPEAGSESLLSWSGTVRVFDKTTTYINRELAAKDLLTGGEILSLEKSGGEGAQVWVNTEPAGLIVALDGEDRGVSPVFMDNISSGHHELSVRGEGFLPRTIKINTVEGYKLSADFKLIMDEAYEKVTKSIEAKKKKSLEAKFLEIIDTPTGWLRVRFEPNLEASEAAQVTPGAQFKYYGSEDNWYEIEYEAGKRGWVSGDYIKEIEAITPTSTPTPTPEEEQ